MPCPLDGIIHIGSKYRASVFLSSFYFIMSHCRGAGHKRFYPHIGKLRLERRSSPTEDQSGFPLQGPPLYYTQLSQLGVTFHYHTLLSM